MSDIVIPCHECGGKGTVPVIICTDEGSSETGKRMVCNGCRGIGSLLVASEMMVRYVPAVCKQEICSNCRLILKSWRGNPPTATCPSCGYLLEG
jgi:hypothetical protein